MTTSRTEVYTSKVHSCHFLRSQSDAEASARARWRIYMGTIDGERVLRQCWQRVTVDKNLRAVFCVTCPPMRPASPELRWILFCSPADWYPVTIFLRMPAVEDWIYTYLLLMLAFDPDRTWSLRFHTFWWRRTSYDISARLSLRQKDCWVKGIKELHSADALSMTPEPPSPSVQNAEGLGVESITPVTPE